MAATKRPVWLGIALTPWLTPVIFIGLYAIYFIAMGYNRPGLSWLGSLGFSYLFGVPLGYVGVGLLGWPWVAVLRRWHKLMVGYVCLGAVVIGMLLFLLFGLLIGNPQYILKEPSQHLAIGFVIGLLSGLIFCLVAGVPWKNVAMAPVAPVAKPEEKTTVDTASSYEDELQTAMDRTAAWGLHCPAFSFTSERFMTDEFIQRIAECTSRTIGSVPPESVAFQCFAVHALVQRPLEKALGIPLLYTVGYISHPGRTVFHTDEADLKAMLTSGKQVPGVVNMHAWLTLPSHEIVDLTYPTAYGVRNDIPELIGNATALHPSDLVGGQEYHPQLVGTDFFEQVGAIKSVEGFGFVFE